jgi:predicted NBD/HSP70 family sugar kinase
MEHLGANERLVLGALRDRSPASRAGLAELTGLPGTTVVGVVARLLARGLVEEQESRPAGRRGRRAALLALKPGAGRIGAIAVSHRKLRCGVVGRDGALLLRRDADLTAARGEAGIIDLAVDLLAGEELDEVVVGVPAPFERGTGVLESPGPEHDEPRLRSDPSAALADRLGVPVTAENDANLGALGEAGYGAGRGLRSFIYVKVAEGLGAGLFLDGSLYRGARGLAGELGHVQVADDGPWCRCGARGCLLHLIKGSARSYLADAYGKSVTFEDELGLRVLTDAGRRVGRVLAGVCTVLAPEAVVVDGALGVATGPFLAGIREMLDRHTAPVLAGTVRLLGGELGDNAELLGAAVLGAAAVGAAALGVDKPTLVRPKGC